MSTHDLMEPLVQDGINPPRFRQSRQLDIFDTVVLPANWVEVPYYGDLPAARVSDPVTSHQAAGSAKELQSRHAGLILDCLARHGPLGKDGIAARTKLTGVAVARRTIELQRARAIRPTGRTVPSTAGRLEREWELA